MVPCSMTVISTDSIELRKVRDTLDYSSGQLSKNFRVSTRELDTPFLVRVSRDCPLSVRGSLVSDIALPSERELVTSDGILREGWFGFHSTMSNPMTQVAQEGSECLINRSRSFLTYSIWIGIRGEVENSNNH
jgi:hypothetical protein